MNGLALVITSACVCALGCSVLNIVLPQGSTKRLMNAVVGVFLVCALIAPIKSAVSGFRINLDSIPKSSEIAASSDEAYKKAVLSATKAELENSVKLFVKENGFTAKKAVVKLKSGESGIIIDSICIYINKNSGLKRLKLAIKEKFGVLPEVITGQ